jgi:hypothetical protein
MEGLNNADGQSGWTLINRLTLEEIEPLICNYLPEYFYIYDKNINTYADYEKTLIRFNETINIEHLSLPRLFTGIKQVSFDNGGFIALEAYNNQIYYLFDAQKNYLSFDSFHDIEFCMNGHIICRSNTTIIWEKFIYTGKEIKKKQIKNIPYPEISKRDVIPEMFDTKDDYQAYYPQYICKTKIEIRKALISNQHAFRTLIDQYKYDPALAFSAIKSNYLAFSFLGNKIKRNKEFALRALKYYKKDEYVSKWIYSLLPRTLQNDIDIIMLVYVHYPELLKKIAPIHDPKMILRIFKINSFPDITVLNYIGNDLKNDKKLFIKLARYSGQLTPYISKQLGSNEKYLNKLKRIYQKHNNRSNPEDIYGELPF